MRRLISLCAVMVCAIVTVAVAADKDQNKRIVKRYIEVWNNRDFAAVNEILADDVVRIGPTPRFSASGREELKAYIQETQSIYPNLKVHINRLESEGDTVILSWTVKATYRGTEFPRAAGQKVKASGTSYYRIVRGRITEERATWDVLGVYRQLGVDPPPDEGQENTGIVLRFLDELYVKGNMDAAYEIVSDDHVLHVPAGKTHRTGREGTQRRAAMFRDAFPDLEFTFNETTAQGDLVALQWTFSGTHNGPFLGAAPTGKRVAIEGLSMSRIKDGKIVESWGYWDTGEFFRQIGVASPGGQ